MSPFFCQIFCSKSNWNCVSLIFPPRDNHGQNNEESEGLLHPQLFIATCKSYAFSDSICIKVRWQWSTTGIWGRAHGQYIYGRATWASNFRFFQPVDFSYFRVIQYRLRMPTEFWNWGYKSTYFDTDRVRKGIRLTGEFAVVPTDKIEGGAYHKKFPLMWTAYLWNCMSHDQRDLKVTYLRNLNFHFQHWIIQY
jgi:hypothetical protein